MSDSTAIQWTDATWNPVTGCTRVSPGCARCYIERTPPFRMEGRRFARVGNAETTGVRLHPDRLEQPLHWRKPRRVFVCSLADLFHEDVPDHFIAGVFAIMGRASQHVFQVLTKRPERARDLLNSHGWPAGGYPNVWLGVSIENARYTWRADVLREIPAAVRFISAEPLLGSLYPKEEAWKTSTATTAEPRSTQRTLARPTGAASPATTIRRASKPLDLTGIDWLIVGGESGPGARPFRLEHARELIDACFRAGVGRPAIFVKQLGSRPTVTNEFLGEAMLSLRDRKGGDPDEWPADLRIREFPHAAREAAA